MSHQPLKKLLPPALRVAIYARVSTQEQAEHGYSLGTQLEACRQKAQELGAVTIREYIDDGQSGEFLDRPALTELRKGLKIGPRGTDQAWFHHMRGPDTPCWTAEDGILHYGKAAFRELPEHARLVTFPGLAKPDSIAVRRKSPWVKQHWPLPGEDVPPAGFDVTPWPVTPSVAQAKPGRFKSLLKQRQEARAERVRMLNAGTVG